MKYIDLYIKNEKMSNYDSTKVENTLYTDILISKLESVVFTNKGEVLGNNDYGCNIPYYLWKTQLDARNIELEITKQILRYVPEVKNYTYKIKFYIIKGTIEDIGVLNIKIEDINISSVFK